MRSLSKLLVTRIRPPREAEFFLCRMSQEVDGGASSRSGVIGQACHEGYQCKSTTSLTSFVGQPLREMKGAG